MMEAATFLKTLEAGRQLRTLEALPQSGGKIRWQQREFLNFCSNDYLNLAADPRLKNAAGRVIEQYGCSTSSSRLLSGHLDLHEELERDLASWGGAEAALVIGSGFLCNLGVVTALTEPGDHIFFDRLNHASLIDAVRLSQSRGVQWTRYKHRDAEGLEQLLQKTRTDGQRWIISDSLFSMDGDLAPLEALSNLAERHGAGLILDEAHAIGIYGPQGSGYARSLGLETAVRTGTFSKALGSYGGFCLCSHQTKSLLVNRARGFIYSTGLPPASAGAAQQAVRILESDPSPGPAASGLGAELLDRARKFHSALRESDLPVPEFESQIIPLMIGDNRRAEQLADALKEAGLFVKAIRPPTVPPGTARLRFSVSLAHSENDLLEAARTIAAQARRLGIPDSGPAGV